jgi:hypothetical protein
MQGGSHFPFLFLSPYSDFRDARVFLEPLLLFSASLAGWNGVGAGCRTPMYIVLGLVILAVDVGLGFVVCAPVANGEMLSGFLLPVLPLGASRSSSKFSGELPRWEVVGRVVEAGSPLNKGGMAIF